MGSGGSQLVGSTQQLTTSLPTRKYSPPRFMFLCRKSAHFPGRPCSVSRVPLRSYDLLLVLVTPSPPWPAPTHASRTSHARSSIPPATHSVVLGKA
ncbi:hypothetical protein E2C01_010091 [Portunus trituberculatus]|uniref:Uncharacterized protein n=1 Tax=Portunus trituberculatus TaxID=210409 RepID=A0A5B7D7G0_PORTR|nr:hypothetical protein [Portunus trituberculatus]